MNILDRLMLSSCITCRDAHDEFVKLCAKVTELQRMNQTLFIDRESWQQQADDRTKDAAKFLAERNDLAVDRSKLGVELTQTRRERDALRDKLIAVDREARMMLDDWDSRSSGPAAMRRIIQLARIDAARKGEA